MLRFQNVQLAYDPGQLVLTDLTFDLPSKTFHFLTGESGAGKSSLLKLIYVSLVPTKGTVTVFGQSTTTISRRNISNVRRHIGIVFQDFRLIPYLSVRENVALPLRIIGTKESVIRRHVPELLEWVGLENTLDLLPHALSGGEQQRVAIARAVIARPTLLLADEPTGNVDDNIAFRLLYLFEELYRSGTTVIVATHNDSLVSKFSYPKIHIENGRAYTGSTRSGV